jgi:hypothetical protein
VTDALKKKSRYEFMVTSMTLKRAWSFRYTTVLCEGVEVWITHIGGYPGKYNPAIKRRWLQIHPNYLWTFTYFEGDVR